MIRFLSLLALCVLCLTARSQDPFFNLYHTNQLSFNPAFAGVEDSNTVSIATSDQFPGYSKHPRSVLFSYDRYLKKMNSGIAIAYLFERIGQEKYHQVGLSYNYNIRLKDKMNLRAGVQLSVVNKTLGDTWISIYPPDSSQPQPQGIASSTKMDIDAGLWYSWSDFYLGLSIKHIIPPVFTYKEEDGNFTAALKPRYYITSGYTIRFSDNLQTTPSFRAAPYSFSSKSFYYIDINNTFLIKNTIYLGASYQPEPNGNSHAIVNSGVKLKNKFLILLAYELPVKHSGAAFEVTSKFKF